MTHAHNKNINKKTNQLLILTARPLYEVIVDPSVTVLEPLAELSDLPRRQSRVWMR